MAARSVQSPRTEGRGLLLSGIEVQILKRQTRDGRKAIGHEEATSVQTPPFRERSVEVQGESCSRFGWRSRAKIALVLVQQSNGAGVRPLR
jgi:hypothetical protein